MFYHYQGNGPSGEELISKVPLYKQKWRVSEADIYKISELLGQGWWEMFAVKIGFQREVEDIKRSYHNSLDNQKYQLLLQWSCRHESKATYRIILKALSRLDKINRLDNVCKLLHAQSEPGPPLPSALERYSDALKSKYSEYKLKAIVDWPPPPAENIVKLAMIGDPKIDDKFIGDMTQGNVGSVLKTKTVIEPDGLFQRIESGGGKVILLEGAPGSGKSTMCWYICKQWGEGKLLKTFSHVIMIELWDKNIQGAKCIADMLPYCESEDSFLAGELKKKEGKNVLVILEGWNELPNELRRESIFKNLITKGARSPLQNAVLLVSSRSNSTVAIHKYAAIRVEALGFTPDQIKAYVEGCFNCKPHKAQELLSLINQNPKVKENCYLPLMLIIIVHLYNFKDTLPESFCGTISELALSCLFRYCVKARKLGVDNDEMRSFDDIPPEIQPQFYHLCELAYRATLEEAFSFSDPQTESDEGLGLLQNVRSIAARGSEVTQYFLHSSLQELCAALHVSRQPVPKQKEMLEQLLEVPQDYVLRFYSALTHWENESVCEVLFKQSQIIQQEMEKLTLIPTLPEPASQDLMMFPNEMVRFPMRFAQILKHVEDTVLHEKPFDRDELTSLIKMGGPELDPFAHDQAEFMQEMMMQLADESFDPDTFRGIDEEKLKNVMFENINRLAIEKGLDPSATAGFVEPMYEQMKSLWLKFMPGIEPLNFMKELTESFGTDEIPREVFIEQITQKFQQEIMKQKIPEDVRQKLGLPLSKQQKVSHHMTSLLQNNMQMLGTDSRYPEFMKSLMPQFLEQNTNPDPQAVTKMFWQIINNADTPSLNQQHLISTLAHGTTAVLTLMLLHCIYEARNPMLASALGSSLVLVGNLNGSDLLALQYMFQMKKDRNVLKSFHLITALSETNLQKLTNALEAGSTIKILNIDIGLYDEKLVYHVLNKSTVRWFRYEWIIPDEETRIYSCKSFCGCLEKNQILQVLDFSGVPILDVGVIELAKVLNTTRLLELNLSRCGIKEEGIKQLCRVLETNHYLIALHLHETTVSNPALQSLSRCLTQNNTLKVIGIVEDPVTAELSEANLQEFVVRLCFNSSVVWLMLNGKYRHTPSLQQALSLVNLTRKLKQQPLLSIDDHYPKNYSPDLYNEFGIRPWEIRIKLTPINYPIVIARQTCYLMAQLPAQEWRQTLPFTLHFITRTKAIGNMSIRHVLKPCSKTIHVNMESKKDKPRSKTVAMVETRRILFPEKELPLQEQHGTLCDSLQFISRFKAVHALCIKNPLPRRRARRKDMIVEVNGHLSDPTSQYPAVVEALQKQRPFSRQPWQQTLFCTQQFVRQSKAVRDMCTSKLLGSNNQKTNIRLKIPQHTIAEYSRIMSSVTVHKAIDPEKEFGDHVHTAKCMAILLSVIRALPGDVDRPLQECAPSTTNNVMLNTTAGLHSAVPRDLISESCEQHKITPPAFNILLPHLLHYLSFLLTY